MGDSNLIDLLWYEGKWKKEETAKIQDTAQFGEGFS